MLLCLALPTGDVSLGSCHLSTEKHALPGSLTSLAQSIYQILCVLGMPEVSDKQEKAISE